MNQKRLRFLARRHAAGRPSRTCSHISACAPCDAIVLVAEVGRMRAWADFASDLLDAHIFGFPDGDWQALEALTHTLEGVDWPPDWKRDLDDAAHIVVDAAVWPTAGAPERDGLGRPPINASYKLLAAWAERGFDPALLKVRSRS